MKIQVLKNENFQDVTHLPKKATDRATGYDIITVGDPEIIGEKYENESYRRVDYIQYKTNLKFAVQQQKSMIGTTIELIDYDILAFPRSSVSKYNLILANCIGLIDADYRGEVLLRFKYIWQPEDYKIRTDNLLEGRLNIEKIYKKGDKICQLKATTVENIEFELVDELDSTFRGDGGFGSTDMKKEKPSHILEMYNRLENIQTSQKNYTQLIKEIEQKQFNS